ncbi:AraC family transcriptional regulator [Kitasatospora sp. CB01950]|uniref:AraC family transcriptional regulator n=1 Tax=Kitasatospora sp. CB01950 TaxID=1703930 RepID=UPI000939CAC9|nr:AraC family transcriptional regulator [Kitasatospora sp. CB01950]OKJ16838.1 AraC family transcriptional regulator [Kitasatospora sp. CB01950]
MDVVSDAISTVRIGRPSSNRVRVSGSWCARFAPYDGAGFHVVLSGGCRLFGADGIALTLAAGDAVLLPRGAGHVLADAEADPSRAQHAVPFEEFAGELPKVPPGSPGEVELLCGKYRLDHSRAHPLLAELPDVVHLPNRVGHHPELRSAIDLLGRELNGHRPGSGIAVPSLLDLLLVYMVRARLAEDSAGAWPAALADPVTAAAVRALHADPAAPWTNDRLAAEVGVSRATLARRFTTLIGRPPMAYLTWWRLALAAARLRDTPDPLAAIARQVGYGTPYALSHAFLREFGTTPGRYRSR